MKMPPTHEMTPQQYLDVLLAADPDARHRMAHAAIRDAGESDRGWHCEMEQHEMRLEDHDSMRDQLWVALGSLHEAVDQMSEAAQPGVNAALLRLGQIVSFAPDAGLEESAAAREARRREKRDQERAERKARDDAEEAAALGHEQT